MTALLWPDPRYDTADTAITVALAASGRTDALSFRRPSTAASRTANTANAAASARAPAPTTPPITARAANAHWRRPRTRYAAHIVTQTIAADSKAHDDGFVDGRMKSPRGTIVTARDTTKGVRAKRGSTQKTTVRSAVAKRAFAIRITATENATSLFTNTESTE